MFISMCVSRHTWRWWCQRVLWQLYIFALRRTQIHCVSATQHVINTWMTEDVSWSNQLQSRHEGSFTFRNPILHHPDWWEENLMPSIFLSASMGLPLQIWDTKGRITVFWSPSTILYWLFSSRFSPIWMKRFNVLPTQRLLSGLFRPKVCRFSMSRHWL